MGRLDGRVCVITGAGGSLGREVARLFSSEGAELCVADIDGDAAQETAAVCEGTGAIAVRVDVTDQASVAALYDAASAVFGGVDVIFNGAGLNHAMTAEDTVDPSLEVWRHVQSVNSTGTFLSCTHGIELLLRGGGGSVINGTPPLLAIDDDAAAASRGSVLALTRTLARRFAGRGIRVNALCPGPVSDPASTAIAGQQVWVEEQDALPMRRLAEPSEIAPGALFLASDESSYMTGVALVVDGGLSVGRL